MNVKIGPPFEELTPDEQEAIRAWLRGHGLDPADVPTTGIEHLPRQRRYQIAVAERDDRGRWLISCGEPLIQLVLVSDKVPLPWPKREVGR